MFQVPQMNPEKKQTTRFRDFSAGKITDPDTFDLRPEAFDTVKNLRIYHGKLRGFNDVELETVHTTPGVGDVWYAASFLHSRDNAGNIDSTEFLYTIGDGGDWYRYYDDGGWAENSMGITWGSVVDSPAFTGYDDIVNIGGSHDEENINVQYIDDRDRFSADATYNVDGWIFDESEMAAPDARNEGEASYSEWNDSADYAADSITFETSEDTSYTSSPFVDGEQIQYALSFVRDGDQESALQPVRYSPAGIFAGETATTTISSNGARIGYNLYLDADLLTERITAIKIYHRKRKAVGYEFGVWYYLKTVDIDTAIDDDGWVDGDATFVGLRSLKANGSYYYDGNSDDQDAWVYTYNDETGWDEETESTSCRYKHAVLFRGRTAVANVYKNSKTYPGRIYVSAQNRHETFPDSYYIDLTEDDNKEFTGLAIWQNRLIAFKESEVFVVDISSPLETAWRVIDKKKIGAYRKDAICVTRMGVYFANDTGVWVYNGNFTNILLEKNQLEYRALSSKSTTIELVYEPDDDEVIMYVGSSTAWVFNPNNRLTTMTLKDETSATLAHRLFNRYDGRAAYVITNSSSHLILVNIKDGTGYENIDLKTGNIFFGTDDNKILKSIEVRWSGSASAQPYLALDFDNEGFSSIANYFTAADGADDIDDEQKAFKKFNTRFKYLNLQIYTSASYHIEIREIIIKWIPRRGMINE